jgi:hypothetical protein
MVHEFTHASKITVCRHMLSYNTHFVAHTIEAQISVHLLHRHLTQGMDVLIKREISR